jgi:hypothetical protein
MTRMTREKERERARERETAKERRITVLFGAPPYDGLVGTAEQEADGHDSQVVLHIHWRPPGRALVHLLSLRRTLSANGTHLSFAIDILRITDRT